MSLQIDSLDDFARLCALARHHRIFQLKLADGLTLVLGPEPFSLPTETLPSHPQGNPPSELSNVLRDRGIPESMLAEFDRTMSSGDAE